MTEAPDHPPWDRMEGEPPKGHAAFRTYRDMRPFERDVVVAAAHVGLTEARARRLSMEWGWEARAEAWDDECHRIEDVERLEAIRAMHALHRDAGRRAITFALGALDRLDPDDIPASSVARLLELGAKLERSTLIVSVEELQGIEDEKGESPWEAIGRELTG